MNTHHSVITELYTDKKCKPILASSKWVETIYNRLIATAANHLCTTCD